MANTMILVVRSSPYWPETIGNTASPRKASATKATLEYFMGQTLGTQPALNNPSGFQIKISAIST